MPLTVKVPGWTNQDMVLYHGTTFQSALNIAERGVNLHTAKPLTDFGKGFYTTTRRTQAVRFAKRLRRTRGQAACLVEFRVERGALAKLLNLSFVLGLPESLEYWSFVQHCRGSWSQVAFEQQKSPYDIVQGPVARNWDKLTLYRDFDQISFHSEAALALLNIPGARTIIPI